MTTANIMPAVSAMRQQSLPGAATAAKAAETVKNWVSNAWDFMKQLAVSLYNKARHAIASSIGWLRSAVASNAVVGSVAGVIATPSGSRFAATLIDKGIRLGGRLLSWGTELALGAVRALGRAVTRFVSLFSENAAEKVDSFWNTKINRTLSAAALYGAFIVVNVYDRIRSAYSSKLTVTATSIAAGAVAVAQFSQAIPVVASFAAPIIATLSALPVVGWIFAGIASAGFTPLLIIAGVATLAASVSLTGMAVLSKRQGAVVEVVPEGVKVSVGTDGEAIIPNSQMPNVVAEVNRNVQQQRNAANKHNNPNQQRRPR